jgi:hypothetical protein
MTSLTIKELTLYNNEKPVFFTKSLNLSYGAKTLIATIENPLLDMEMPSSSGRSLPFDLSLIITKDSIPLTKATFDRQENKLFLRLFNTPLFDKKISGFAILSGLEPLGCHLSFDQDPISLSYHNQNLTLLHPNVALSAGVKLLNTSFDRGLQLDLEVEKINLETKQLKLTCNEKATAHYAFNNGHTALLPLKGITYLEKKSGLVFEDVSSTIRYQHDLLNFDQIQATCQNLDLGGALTLDLFKEDRFVLDVYPKKAIGELKDVIAFIQHFTDTLPSLPLEGTLDTIDPKTHLQIEIGKDLLELKGEIAGFLQPKDFEKCHFQYVINSFEEMDMALHLRNNFSFDALYQNNLLTLNLDTPYDFHGNACLTTPFESVDAKLFLKDKSLATLLGKLNGKSFSLSSLTLFDKPIKDVKNLCCEMTSDPGITFRFLPLEVTEEGKTIASFHFEKLSFPLDIDGFHFSFFPNLAREFLEIPSFLNDPLTGNLNYRDGLLKVALEPTSCFSNTIIERDPSETRVFSTCNFAPTPFYFLFTTPDFKAGELILTETKPENFTLMPDSKALVIDWEIEEKKPIIKRANGRFFGLTCDLETRQDNILAGQIDLFLQKALQLLPLNLQEKLTPLKLGKGYSLNGKWRLNFPDFAFDGKLKGSDFDFFGYQLDSLTSGLHFSNEGIRLEDLQIKDRALTLFAEEVNIDNTDLHLPHIALYNFSPQRLKVLNQPYCQAKSPFTFRHIELQNLRGNLKNLSSLTASGSLSFFNPPKTIAETLLAPVTGTVAYELKEGRLHITKFQDVFTLKRSSQYYLPKSPIPNTIDLSGKLRLQIAMKHSNLLFKPAEFFTLTLHGSLPQVSFTLSP